MKTQPYKTSLLLYLKKKNEISNEKEKHTKINKKRKQTPKSNSRNLPLIASPAKIGKKSLYKHGCEVSQFT